MSRICPQCEYNLTGLPEPCVCPECGRAIEVGMRCVPALQVSSVTRPVTMMIFAAIGLLFLWFTLYAAYRGGSGTGWLCSGIIAFVCLWTALHRAGFYLRRVTDDTRSYLYLSPTGIGITDSYGVVMYDWRHIGRFRIVKALWRNSWLVEVRGQNMMGSPQLLVALLPSSRRVAARVRALARKSNDAWKQSQGRAQSQRASGAS